MKLNCSVYIFLLSFLSLFGTVFGEPQTFVSGWQPVSGVGVGDKLYVMNSGDNNVAVIDTKTNTKKTTISV